MLPSAPGSAVIVIWLPEVDAERTTGPFATQSVALICAVMFVQTACAVMFVSVAPADPSELETAIGPATVLLSLIVISLLYVPPTVAVQLGSEALICEAIDAAISALPKLPSTTEYVAAPIVTECVYVESPCHHMAWMQEGENAGTM